MQENSRKTDNLQNPYIKLALENPQPTNPTPHPIPMVYTPEPYEIGKYCLECGKLLPERTRPNGRKRLFCSEAHKKIFNRRLQKKIKEETKEGFKYWILPGQIDTLVNDVDEDESKELIKQMAFYHGYAASLLATQIVITEKLPLLKLLSKMSKEKTELETKLSTLEKEIQDLKSRLNMVEKRGRL